MSEERSEYDIEEQGRTEVEDAIAILRHGSPIEIHAPHTVVEMNAEYDLEEVRKEAWIKLSIGFRDVMKHMRGPNLSVFLAIALGINTLYESYPAIKTIAEWTGYSRRTVISAVQELTESGFLTIKKGIKKSNLYHVNAFAAFGKTSEPIGADIAQVQPIAPIGANDDTKTPKTCLKLHPNKRTRLNNKTLKPNLEEALKRKELQRSKKGDLVDGFLNYAQSPALQKEKRMDELQSRLAVAFNINASWNKWERFIKYADKQEQDHGQTIEHFAAWLKTKANYDISFYPPDKMQELWPQAFDKKEEVVYYRHTERKDAAPPPDKRPSIGET